MSTKLVYLIFMLCLACGESAGAAVTSGRSLKFEGLNPAATAQLKRRYPFVFERKVSLSEVDEILRFLMTTKTFSNIEVTERDQDLVMTASVVRRISEIRITGNKELPESELLRVLQIAKDQTFERKDLVAAADQLQDLYGDLGFLNARIEIDFQLPNDRDVEVGVKIEEGPPCKVMDVSFETPSKELSDRAKRMSRTLLKKPLSQDNVMAFQKDLTDYFAQNRFLTARLSAPAIAYNRERSEARLTYLIESAYRYEFLFEGNTYFEDGGIIRQIELDKLFGLTTSPAADLADRTRKLYQANGFANVEIEYKERIFEESQRYQIRFEIKENPRVRIKGLDITGPVSRKAKYYTGFIVAHSSELIQKGYYNRKDIETGYENLVVDLQNQGYLRAKVQSVRTEYSKDRQFVTVFIALDEGPLTQVRDIKFSGAREVAPEKLAEITTVRGKSSLSLKEVEVSIQKVKDYYRNEGYLDMKLLNERAYTGEDALVSYNDNNTQADVNFIIQEGPKVVVASVTVDGNTFTKENVILRELEFKKGDVLTPEKIGSSLFRLQEMELFSRVNIRTLEEGTNISERTVIIEVQERDPGLFTSGLGITNERDTEQGLLSDITYRGYLGLSYRNLGGTGRGLSGRVGLQYSSDPDIKFLENTVTVGYLEPYILGGRYRGRVNLTREQKFFTKSPAATNGDVTVLIQERNAVDFLVERSISRRLKLTYTFWGFSNQRRLSILNRGDPVTVDPQNIGKIGPLFELDYRDNAFNPTKGSYSFLNLEYADPLLGSSDDSKKTSVPLDQRQIIQFTKANAGTTQYIRLGDSPRWVFATSVRAGYLANVSNKPASGVPVTETFSLGGRSTIRGFDARDIERIPNWTQLMPNAERSADLSRFKVSADSYFYLMKFELRFPIAGELGGAFFYDGGAVLVNQPDVNIKDPYRDSFGFGFRYNTPVGPVNLEIGFKLDRKSYANGEREGEKAIHFSIGTF